MTTSPIGAHATAFARGVASDVLDTAGARLADRLWLLVAVALAAVAVYVTAVNVIANVRHRHHARGARLVLIAAPPEVDPKGALAWWTHLRGVLTPSVWHRLLWGAPHVGLEYRWAGRRLQLAVWVPGTVPPGAVEAAVRAAWPGAVATVDKAGPPPIPTGGALAAGGALVPALADTLPLDAEQGPDPLRPLIAAGAQIHDNEYVCLQVLARPASPRRARNARRAARNLRTGNPDPLSKAVNLAARAALLPLMWLVELFLPGPSRPPAAAGRDGRYQPLSARDPASERDVRLVLDKTTAGPLYEVAIRYAVAAGTTRGDRRRTLQRLRGLGHTIASSSAAHDSRNTLRRLRLPHPAAALAGRRLRRGFLASLPELAHLAGLPTDLAVPGMERARAKSMPAPPAIPSGGRGIRTLGYAQPRDRTVGLPAADLRHHLHLVGKTGTGKSTVIVNMVVDDVKAGRGAVVIDPRGDLVGDILDRLPVTASERVHIIDPAQERSAYFNPLDPDDPHLSVDNLIGIFSRIFQRHWGPRIDDTLRVALLTLFEHGTPTLGLVPPLLNDDHFRGYFTAGLRDVAGRHGYWQWYDSMPPPLRAQVVGPVLARLRQFLLRDFVKDTVGVAGSSFDMGEVLDGGLLLVRLPKGILGEETTKVLGSLVVAKVWQAATARASLPEHQRKDASMYIDECHNFLNLPSSVADMLAEARGYRLGLVLAHQHLDQLPKDVGEGASANARNKLFFTVDPHDAAHLATHTLPELNEHDLSHLDRYTAAARLVVDGREQPAFTLTTRQPPPVIGAATAIRQACSAAVPPIPANELEAMAHGYAEKARQREADRKARRGRPDPGPDGRPAPPAPPGPAS